MKKTLGVFWALLFSFAFCVSVWADGDKGQTVDYVTDYYMIVESKDGGINIYASADTSGGKLNSQLIPNGTALHIKGEKKDAAGKEWGLTEYHGMKGFVLFKDLKPVTLSEAVKSELGVLGSEEADEDFVIGAKAGSVKMYTGPGEKFPEISSSEILNGETVHISMKAETEDGEMWGKVTGREKEGWINLSEAGERQGTGKGSERAVDKKAPVLTEAPKATGTPAPTEAPKATGTPAPTETPQTIVTLVPTKEPEQEEAETASSQSVDSVSALFMNPILWIVAAVILLALVFLYFLKLK
ncbi:MAG: hypothetical protein ACLVD2_05080 [Blautia sp.]